jgi:hypothetical protein
MGVIHAQPGADVAVSILGQREGAQVRRDDETIAGEYDEAIPGNGVVDEIFTESETGFLLGMAETGNDVPDMGCGTVQSPRLLPAGRDSRAGALTTR